MFPSQFRLAFALSVAIVIVGASAFLVAGGGAAVGAEEGGTAGATPTPAVKANDDFADAVVIPEPLPFTNKQSTTGATLETGEPNDTSLCLDDNSATIGATVWYQYTPSQLEFITASTFGNFDSFLAVYTGSTLGSLTRQACAVGDPDTSFLVFANGGETYYFQVGGSNSQSGHVKLSLVPAFLATPTANPTPTPLPTPCSAPGCPSMSLRVSGTSAGSPTSCDSNTVTKCTLDPGSAFTLEIVPDGIPVSGYGFWQTLLQYGSLDYKPRPTAADEITWDLSFQPLRAPEPPQLQEEIGHGDLSSFFEPHPLSTQTTALVTIDFDCVASDTLSLIAVANFPGRPDGAVFGGADSDILVVPQVGLMEINCVGAPGPVGGIALEPHLGAPALDAPDRSPANTRPWAIAAAITASLIELTGAAWYAKRPARE